MLRSQVKQVLKKVLLAKKGERRIIVQKAKRNLIRIICEVCLNLEHNNIKLNSRQRQSLKKYKKLINFLSLKGCWRNKKHALIKKGKSLISLLFKPSIIRAILKCLSNKNE